METDRLEEEKRRGISIELGFAHLDLGEGMIAAFIDVPGHERFVKTMVAGAAGIDAVLLVIAADESIKPQTREHFAICRLLGVQRGIVVLTKVDAVDPDLVELVKLEAEEFVEGSFLQGAPVLAVSARTGEGLQELRTEIVRVARNSGPRRGRQPMRLPVDRAFAMKGFGTVVTGTLAAGSLTPEQEVELLPGGRKLRVRGVQVHGRAAKEARAGQRTAVNLAGIEQADVARGMVLANPGQVRPVGVIDCRITLLEGVKALHERTPVHFHAGTAEVTGTVRPLGDGFARIRLREPLVLLPGDRFILRRFSPVVTIGGGDVVETDPPRRTRVTRLAGLSAADRARILVAEAGMGLAKAELDWRAGEPVEAGVAAGDWRVGEAWLNARIEEMLRALAGYHRANPLRAGMPREELRSSVAPRAPLAHFDLLIAQAGQAVKAENDSVRLASHRVRLEADEQAARQRMERAFAEAGLAVPDQKEVLAKCGVDSSRAVILLAALLKDRVLVRVSAELVFHHAAIENLRALLAARKGQRFSVPEFKEWTGCSRRYAIPLLEYFDRERVTRREGDARTVV